MASATSRAFDRHSTEYADEWDARPLVRLWRARVVSRCSVRFPFGGTILDLGCGTGTDARLLSAIGFRVRGVDVSPGMVSVARSRGADASVGDLLDVREPVDGILSDFGALDCVADGPALGEAVRRVLPVGRWLIAVVMSPFCPVESLALMARGRHPFRRRPTVGLRGERVGVAWWTPGELVAALGPGFRLVHTEALGVLVPPPDLGGRPDWRATLDTAFGGLPVLRALGDHTICEIRRVA